MSDKALSHSMVETTLEMMVTSSERRMEHRSVLLWGFTHQLQNSDRLDLEVCYRAKEYFAPVISHKCDIKKRIQVENMEVDYCSGSFTHNFALVGRPCFLRMQGVTFASGRTRGFLSRPFIDRSDLVTTQFYNKMIGPFICCASVEPLSASTGQCIYNTQIME